MAFLLIIALVVLGPEKLPEAVRKFGKFYGEFKKMSSGFQSELRNVLDEPMREMRETADTLREVAQFDFEPTRVDGDTGQTAAAPSAAAAPAAVRVIHARRCRRTSSSGRVAGIVTSRRR